VTLAALLVAAYVVAVWGRGPLESGAVVAEGFAEGGPARMQAGTDSPMLSAAQIMQLRLPPGLRLDSNEAIMIASAGADRRVVFVNPAFARLTGHEAKDWVGRSGDLLSAEGLLCAEAHLHLCATRNGMIGLGHIVLVMTDVTSRVSTGKARGSAQRDFAVTPEARKSA
jgi:PAS domain-containing protein